MAAEIDFDRLELATVEPDVLDVLKRLPVPGPAAISDKCLIAPDDHALQLKALDVGRLPPALRLKRDFADVIVVGSRRLPK